MGKLWRPIWRALTSTRLAILLLTSLGTIMLAGTLLPQLPPAADESTRATWFGLAQVKHGSLFRPLQFLGLFELYQSPGCVALFAALFVNTSLCTLSRLRALCRMMRGQRTAALGSVTTHFSFIALVLSLMISQGYAWESSAVPLAGGEAHRVGHGTDIVIRSHGFRVWHDNDGLPIDYSAEMTALEGAQPVRASVIKPNAPLRTAGISVWLLSYEPAVRVRARTQQGDELMLESEAGVQSHGEATFYLAKGPTIVRLPSEGMEVRISGQVDGQATAHFDLRVLRGGSAVPLIHEGVPSGHETPIGGIHLTLEDDHYVIYRVKHDPGAVAVLISALGMVVGTTLSLFSRREHSRCLS